MTDMKRFFRLVAQEEGNDRPLQERSSDYRPKGCPDRVKLHDFVDEELGKVAPSGVYEIGENVGWVSVGIDHDTSEFAVNSIRRWRDSPIWALWAREIEYLYPIVAKSNPNLSHLAEQIALNVVAFNSEN